MAGLIDKGKLPTLDLIKEQSKNNGILLFNSTDPTGKIINLPIDKLDKFSNIYHHVFKRIDENKMPEMMESIKEHGILNPIIVREKRGQRYEILAGHTRVEAAKRLDMKEVPTIIKDVNDDEALLIMTQTNLQQREKILPSERGWAYRYQLEALQRLGKNKYSGYEELSIDDNGYLDEPEEDNYPNTQKGNDYREDVAAKTSLSGRHVSRYIKLTYLCNEYIYQVDNNEITIRTAVELSYIPEEQQKIIYNYCLEKNIKPNEEHVKQIKVLLDKKYDIEKILIAIFEKNTLDKPKRISQIKIPMKKIKDYVDEKSSKTEIEEKVIEAIEFYSVFSSKENIFTIADAIKSMGEDKVIEIINNSKRL